MGELICDEAEPINNLVTWVYEERTFVPSAKIQGEERFSIISDYIGRPVQCYNENGSLIWETDYDIYGRLRNLQGEKLFIPFRQLGQYEDLETELYYNRFRYYDANTGLYISQDPIALAGGSALYAYVHISNNWVDIFGLHGLDTQIIRGGSVVHSKAYTSGGGIGGGRLNQQEALLTHTERKFFNDVIDDVEPGDHLIMKGQLNPCKPGCQPAIRRFVFENDVTAEYHASDTGMKYSWEKIDGKIYQTETDGINVKKYEYNMSTLRRKLCK